uniref:Uncharacterized protein LOC104218146 isoform X5 n=1 Tax=Nicotiana sylvestris TaxID=4096 RepID=A0A1U7VWU4_NICSY|nr:PREDICTED: uncharacterized protein LOC104218146 isoform X5 [Nicotiana sylvestris]
MPACTLEEVQLPLCKAQSHGIPKKLSAASHQLCATTSRDNMEKGKDICNPLVIHEIGCRSGTSDHCVLTLSTVPTKDLDQPEVDSCGQGIAGSSSDQIEIKYF